MTGRNRRKAFLAIALALASFAFLKKAALRVAASPSPNAQTEISRLAEEMQWKPGMTIADIGAGDGTYSFAAEKIVGASGHIYATELDQDKLKALRDEVAKQKFANVTIVESAADDTKLPTACCDAIFLRRVYHHITAPEAFDKNLLRSLKSGARLAIIDFAPDNSLPPVEGVPANRGGHGIPQEIMVEELTDAGFKAEKTIDHWSGN
ncbi:MAG TPA: methyltransferase domain-containing protein, partial [Candidatus Acidoferrales bacterium]|nr:methyltransferase domain-containing protein [Candidatus Acidoferrales bacterium]